jgi:hypothetical protein
MKSSSYKGDLIFALTASCKESDFLPMLLGLLRLRAREGDRDAKEMCDEIVRLIPRD